MLAVDSGALQPLLRMLAAKSLPGEVRGRVLAALSSLLRQFPFAQLKFVELGVWTPCRGSTLRGPAVRD